MAGLRRARRSTLAAVDSSQLTFLTGSNSHDTKTRTNIKNPARKVSNSTSDLEGRSRTLAMVPFDRPHTISYKSYIATMSLSCTVFEISSLISQNLKWSRDPEHIHFGGNLSFMHYYTSV